MTQGLHDFRLHGLETYVDAVDAARAEEVKAADLQELKKIETCGMALNHNMYNRKVLQDGTTAGVEFMRRNADQQEDGGHLSDIDYASSEEDE
ncbi:Hypp6851 [Branchiostoma lanceolatum]|uniref:Hypp6851 protein n=1 Tax=Branchiostoma lanceolatum TaxID=7740 RepID=A0A8J9YVN5_BRALA|nr:Hypp6851 [Branchiostoma lanceolatum]